MFIAVPSYAPSVGKGGDKIKSASAMKHGNCCFISPLAEATVQRTGQQCRPFGLALLSRVRLPDVPQRSTITINGDSDERGSGSNLARYCCYMETHWPT